MDAALVAMEHQNTPKTTFSLPYLDPFITFSYYKVLQDGSSLASLSMALNIDVVAILYKILYIGSRSHFVQNSSISFGLVYHNFCRNLASLLYLIYFSTSNYF